VDFCFAPVLKMTRRILMVDDQEDMLLIMEREFRRLEGVTLTTANSYAQALELIEPNGIELVISDVRIGRESGFDLASEIGRIYPGIGTILMSAYRSASNRQQAASLGVLAFLEKPFQFPKLKDAIESFYQKREQAPVEPVKTAEQQASDESGALAHFKLQDLVQLFCLNGKNVLITVSPGAQAPAGEIYIQRGRVIHADYTGRTGDDAFHAMMRIGRPLLKVNDWVAPVPVSIATGWEHLLLESAVRMDERTEPDQADRSAVGG